MKILIINNSKISDKEIVSFVNDYFNYLNYLCNDISHYEILIANEDLKNEVLKMNEESENLTNAFINFFGINACLELKGEFAKYFKEEDLEQSKTIILNENAKISNLWGEANNFLAVIKKITKSNFWHEFSHTIGVSDHYDKNSNYNAKSYCDSDNCIMRYGKSSLEFCDYGKSELKKHLNKVANAV